jgi:hypothetical protein
MIRAYTQNSPVPKFGFIPFSHLRCFPEVRPSPPPRVANYSKGSSYGTRPNVVCLVCCYSWASLSSPVPVFHTLLFSTLPCSCDKWNWHRRNDVKVSYSSATPRQPSEKKWIKKHCILYIVPVNLPSISHVSQPSTEITSRSLSQSIQKGRKNIQFSVTNGYLVSWSTFHRVD